MVLPQLGTGRHQRRSVGGGLGLVPALKLPCLVRWGLLVWVFCNASFKSLGLGVNGCFRWQDGWLCISYKCGVSPLGSTSYTGAVSGASGVGASALCRRARRALKWFQGRRKGRRRMGWRKWWSLRTVQRFWGRAWSQVIESGRSKKRRKEGGWVEKDLLFFSPFWCKALVDWRTLGRATSQVSDLRRKEGGWGEGSGEFLVRCKVL